MESVQQEVDGILATLGRNQGSLALSRFVPAAVAGA